MGVVVGCVGCGIAQSGGRKKNGNVVSLSGDMQRKNAQGKIAYRLFIRLSGRRLRLVFWIGLVQVGLGWLLGWVGFWLGCWGGLKSSWVWLGWPGLVGRVRCWGGLVVGWVGCGFAQSGGRTNKHGHVVSLSGDTQLKNAQRRPESFWNPPFRFAPIPPCRFLQIC